MINISLVGVSTEIKHYVYRGLQTIAFFIETLLVQTIVQVAYCEIVGVTALTAPSLGKTLP